MESLKQRIVNIVKLPVAWIVALVTLVALYIKYLQNKNSTLEGQAQESDTKAQDAVLAQQQTDLKAQNDAKIAALEAEKGRKLTDQELNDELNKI